MSELSHEDARDMVESIRRLGERFTGSQRDDDKQVTTRQKFDKTLSRATQGLELMSGSAYTASSALRKIVGYGAFGIAIQSVVDGLTNMSRNFNKMTDVGISFGGSIFQMEKQAGDAGLSMEEFARTIEKNSTIVAQMGDTQVQGVKQFSNYQHGVRDNLKQFGYFGETLAQVNDQSGEFAENLRRSGQLDRMTDVQQSKASAEFITQINAMSHATGKSREEILKLTNQAIRDPAAAVRLSQLGTEASKAFMSTAATLAASMGQAGADLSHMFAQTMGAKGRTWATEMGDVAIQAGIPGFNAAMERISKATEAGGEPTEDMFQEIGRMKDMVSAHADTLLDLRMDPQARAGVDKLLAWLAEMQNYDPKKALARARKAREEELDGVTQAVQMFQTNLMEMTGKFRSGFFKSILDFVAPTAKDGKAKAEEFQKTMNSLNVVMEDLGKTVGFAFGLVVAVLPAVTWGFGILIKTMDLFRSGIEKALSFIPGFQSHDKTNERTGEVTNTNYARMISSMITVVAAAVGAFYLKKKLMGALKMEARVVNITTRSVTGLGGAGGAADLLGGGEHPGGTPRKGIFKGFREGGLRGGFRNMFSGASSLLKGGGLLKMAGGGAIKLLSRGLIGAVLGALFDSFLNIFGEFKGKKTLSSVASYAGMGAAIGSFIPIPFVGTLIGTVVGGIVGAIVENFDGLNISSMIEGAWHGAKWVADLFNGMMEWMAKQFRDAMPGWMQKILGVPKAPGPQTAGTAARTAGPTGDPADIIARMVPQISETLQNIGNFRGDPDMGANAEMLSKALAAVTPEIMAATISKVQSDTDRRFLNAPIKDDDSFETLNRRLVDLMALKAIDEKKEQAGDKSVHTELLQDIFEQMQIQNALLHRGNNQREDGNRRPVIQQ